MDRGDRESADKHPYLEVQNPIQVPTLFLALYLLEHRQYCSHIMTSTPPHSPASYLCPISWVAIRQGKASRKDCCSPDYQESFTFVLATMVVSMYNISQQLAQTARQHEVKWALPTFDTRHPAHPQPSLLQLQVCKDDCLG